jgi:hypothetical protein
MRHEPRPIFKLCRPPARCTWIGIPISCAASQNGVHTSSKIGAPRPTVSETIAPLWPSFAQRTSSFFATIGSYEGRSGRRIRRSGAYFWNSAAHSL